MSRNHFWLPAKVITIWSLFGANILALAAGLLFNSYAAISLSIVVSGLIYSLVGRTNVLQRKNLSDARQGGLHRNDVKSKIGQ